MSFAIIQTGGKQYKVSASEILKIERLNNQEGKTVEFKNVLFLKTKMVLFFVFFKMVASTFAP